MLRAHATLAPGPAVPAQAAAPAPAPTAAPPGASAAAPAAESAPITREPPLTAEEIQLIESDPSTLTPELRRKRAHALRRKIMQNPDSPAARQLESLRHDVESGTVTPSLPTKDLVLHAPTGPAPAGTPEPGKAP